MNIRPLILMVLVVLASASCAVRRDHSKSEEKELISIMDMLVGAEWRHHNIGPVDKKLSDVDLRLSLIKAAQLFGAEHSWANIKGEKWSPLLQGKGYRGIICVEPPGFVVVFIKDDESDAIFALGSG